MSYQLPRNLAIYPGFIYMRDVTAHREHEEHLRENKQHIWQYIYSSI